MSNAIELALFSSRINAICEQMGAVLQQTAFSPNIRDRLDYSCAIFDAEGQLCAQAAHIPVHLGSMAFAMRDIVRARKWQDGDTVILNNPFMGGTHLPDVTFISPVFVDSQLHAFVTNRAHHADIGSESPGSMPISSSIEEEGMLISPTLIGKDGRILEDVLHAFTRQLRAPAISEADFKAQFSVNQTGKQVLIGLINNCTQNSFADYLQELNEYARRIAGHVLASIPDGEYRFHDVMDDDGLGNTDITIDCTVRAHRGDITLDFTGTSHQVKGNINCPLSVTAAAVYYCFRCLMPDYIPNCAGSFDLIKLQVPERSLLHAEYPAAVAAGNVETSTRVVDVVLGALAQAIPEKIPAASHGSMNNLAMGAEHWSYYETLGGGMGASKNNDGCNAVQTHMTNTLNTPVEILELHYPLRLKAYGIRTGSGGDGLHSGGAGLVRHYQFLQPAHATLLTERRHSKPWGLKAGESGKAGENRLNGKLLAAKTSMRVNPGDELVIKTPGGGGWGKSKRVD